MQRRSAVLTTRSRLWHRVGAAAALHTFVAALAAACGPPPLSQVPGPPVNVRIDPPGGELTRPVAVSVRAQGAPRLDCVAPCGMTAPSGTHLVQVSGPRSFATIVTIPGHHAVGRVRFGNTGLRTVGNVFNGIGGVFAAVGGALTPINGVGPILLLSIGGAGLLFLIPGIIMVAAAGPDTIEFTPWTDHGAAAAAGARSAERRRLAASAHGAEGALTLVAPPLVQF